MKEKIEEILEAYTNYGFGENLDNVIEMEFKMKTPTGKVGKYIGYPSLVNELTTLIQEEREEAVRGFVDTLPNYIEMTDGVHSVVRHIPIQDEVRKIMETYLQSLESEGK